MVPNFITLWNAFNSTLPVFLHLLGYFHLQSAVFIMRLTYLDNSLGTFYERTDRINIVHETERHVISSGSPETRGRRHFLKRLVRDRRDYLEKRMLNDVSEASRIRNIIVSQNKMKRRPRKEIGEYGMELRKEHGYSDGEKTILHRRPNTNRQIIQINATAREFDTYDSKYSRKKEKSDILRLKPISDFPDNSHIFPLMGLRHYT